MALQAIFGRNRLPRNRTEIQRRGISVWHVSEYDVPRYAVRFPHADFDHGILFLLGVFILFYFMFYLLFSRILNCMFFY